MTRRGYENLVTGVTAKLPGDWGQSERAVVDEPPKRTTVAEKVIHLPETPIAKPRMTRRDKWLRRKCVVRYREWCDRLRAVAGEIPPADKVLDLSWTATFAMPKTWSKRKKEGSIYALHCQKPDRDNLDKAILDALYPGGDAGIAKGTIRKMWGEEASLEIRILYKE